VPYICVPEFQKDGTLHFHILFQFYMSWQQFRSIWQYGYVYPVTIRSTKYLAYYLTKYFTKSLDDPRLYYKKRFFTSRNLLKPLIIKGRDVAIYFLLLGKRLSMIRRYEGYNTFVGNFTNILFYLKPLSP